VTRSRSPDFWSGLALAALGVYIVVQARGWEYLGEEGPGPGFFPLWFGIAMVALSVFLMLRPTDASVDWRGTGRALATWAALAASVAMMKVVGFLISFAALAFFLVLVMYGRSARTAALVALALAAGFYAVFPLALGVALP
jgi:putative tricarboxylic transport membrane protein